jgi:hypothetical protein
MSRIEFFFDPTCPWAWITSRWVEEVAGRRRFDVRWRFISLEVLNAHKPDRRDSGGEPAGRHDRAPTPPLWQTGSELLRIAAAVREQNGNEAVGDFYTVCGDMLHTGGRAREIWKGGDGDALVKEAVEAAGLDDDVLSSLDDPLWAKTVQSESELALERTGTDVGTPIITFDVDRPEDASLFGPVINRIPRGEEAERLWDAVETVARTPGIAELKRSIRGRPNFD